MTGTFSAEEYSEGTSYDIIQPPTSVVPPLNQQKDVCHVAAPSRSHTRSRGNCPGGPCRLSQRQSLSDPARRPRHHLQDDDFTDLYSHEGQPGLSAWRLALVTIMQFRETLSDRQAAESVRARIDWKYLLSLDLS